MLVVDASVLAPALADNGQDGALCRAALATEALAAPDLLRIEVLSVLRRQHANGTLTATQADAAIEDLTALPIAIYPTAPLLGRVWELRHNISAYDACYIALAEAIRAPLATADARLTNAPGSHCAFLNLAP